MRDLRRLPVLWPRRVAVIFCCPCLLHSCCAASALTQEASGYIVAAQVYFEGCGTTSTLQFEQQHELPQCYMLAAATGLRIHTTAV